MTATSIRSVLTETSARLRASGVDEPELCAQHLLAEVLGCRRLELSFHALDAVSRPWKGRLEELSARLMAGEPLQYVLGHVEFMGLRIQVDARALIPRPETEELVDRAVRFVAGRDRGAAADVGTGSGCIAIALAQLCPGWTVWALDLSDAALELAAENVRRHGLEDRVRLARSNLLDAVPGRTLDLIVSNPPYVSAAAYAALPNRIRGHEPRMALAAGPEGLDLLAPLIRQAHAALVGDGCFLAEIGADQDQAVTELARAAGFLDVKVHCDLAGLPRILSARR